jgi:hypothetical protein
MSAILNIKGFELKLDNSEQLTPQGKLIRCAGIERNGQTTIYFFKVIGTHDFIKFEFDYNDKFLKTIV